MSSQEFAETLPAQCPPADAISTALMEVYRLVPKIPITGDCFDSHMAKGLQKPVEYNATDCEWASCSLFDSVEALLKIKGLRKRNKYIAKLNIPAGSGSHLRKKAHINFWRYNDFDISEAVADVWEHGRS